MRDSEIEQWVLNEIRLRTNGRLKEVCVVSTNGVVSLRGTVLNRVDKLAAQEAVSRARGVVGIVNQLNLRQRRADGLRASIKKQDVPVAARIDFPTTTLPALHN